MILMLSVRLAATAHAYLEVHAPTNVLIRALRGSGRQLLAFSVSATLTVAYGLLGARLTSSINSGGPGWLNPLALLCAWNTIKFAWLAVAALLLPPWRRIREGAARVNQVRVLPRRSTGFQ